jgi:hypothetical protein
VAARRERGGKVAGFQAAEGFAILVEEGGAVGVGRGDVVGIGSEDGRACAGVERVERNRLERVLGEDPFDTDRCSALASDRGASGDLGDHARIELDAFSARLRLESRQWSEPDGVRVAEPCGADRDPAPASLAALCAVGPLASDVSLLEERA